VVSAELSGKVLDVLIVDADVEYAALVARELEAAGLRARCHHAGSAAELESSLERRAWDLVLCDYAPFGIPAGEALQRVRTAATDVLVISVAHSVGEETAVELLKAGAADHVPKHNLARLVPSIERALAEAELWRALEATNEDVAQREERFRMLAQHARDVLFRYAVIHSEGLPEYRIEYLSAAFETMTGYHPDELIENPSLALEIIHTDDRTGVRARFEEPHQLGDPFAVRWMCRNGDLLWMEYRVTPLFDDRGTLIAIEGVARDITLLKEMEAQLTHQALHDPLTLLPNRRLFFDHLEQALARRRREGIIVALLFIDLDGLKAVNDVHGHQAGDVVLAAIADRIRTSIRLSDTAARIGGDEFAVVMPDLLTAHDAVRMAERLERAISSTAIPGFDGVISASVGIAVAGNEQDRGEDLVQRADAAMYSAKARGGSGVRLFDDEFGAIVEARLEMENDLRQAIERDQLALVYQPVVDLRDLSVVGVEALVRWNRASYGELVASEFIDIAEESGLAVLLDRWVMRAVCKQAAHWQKIQNGASPVTHINVSRASLARPALASEVASAVEESQVDPSRICVELPQVGLLQDLDESVARLDDLHRLGVNLSIDGFGSAETSLWHLRRMPVASVKVDRAVVRNSSHNPLDAGLIATVVQLADSIGFDVIAEGVERADQQASLIALGCKLAQGFALGRPQAASAIDERLRS
jgi:diguanylate cyclase (GGDEF)-like protein/PAS domain S-box-containing protein